MTATSQLILIAAVARNGVIGRDNQLLWHLPEDMAHFRRTTQGCPVIMGRKTWDSLPERFRPLPGRRNVVLSRQADLPTPGAELAPSLAQALDRLQGAPRIFVIGGEQIYRLALPLADQLCLTEIAQDFDGDAWFPAWSRTDFVELDRRELPSSTPGGLDLAFVTYQRQTPRI